MSTIDDQLISSIAQTVPPTEQSQAEMVNGTVENTTQQQGQPTEMEGTPTTPEPIAIPPTTTVETPTEPDYNKWLENVTGGLFTDVDAFKAALPKVTQYDTLKQERDAFELKTKENPFADEYVQKLNDLKKNGASADQIENFHKINNIGDIKEMSPVDAKVAKLVLIDGYRESVARKMVERDYPVGDYEDGSDDKELLEEKLRVDANADKKALEQFKAQASVVDTTAQEQQKLADLAKHTQHEQQVKQTVPQIAQNIVGMGEIDLKPSKDGDAIKMKFDYPTDFKANIPLMLNDYFMDGLTPITNESVQEAYRHINASYLDQYFPVLAQKILEQGIALATEAVVNKYENKSGLPQSPEIQVHGNNDQQTIGDFMKEIARGR